jgi:hypothetical protein
LPSRVNLPVIVGSRDVIWSFVLNNTAACNEADVTQVSTLKASKRNMRKGRPSLTAS